MLAINETLQGRYRIIRQLGRGGMGAVYEAEDTKRFGKSVALKEILLDFAKIPDVRQQELVRHAFEREAKILTQLEDDAFPKVIDYFLETNRQFLVMELIPGDDLAELLEKRQCAFPLEDVLKWADQLLEALDYLHTLNPPIIHRDIKPHNLKLNSRRKIKLLDFGIAKDTGAEVNSTVTNQTFVGATLNYSPLEQLLRIALYSEPLKSIYGERVENILNQPADARSDIYSLGATLYHLLTNVLPLDGYRRTIKIWEGSPDPLLPPHQLNPSIPPRISNILLKSMEAERENRFNSAIEMQTALHEAVSLERRSKEDEERRKWFEEQEKIKRGQTENFIEDKTEPDNLAFEATEPLIVQPSTETGDSNTANEFDWSTSPATDLSMSMTSPSYLDDIELKPEVEPEPVEKKEEEKQRFVPDDSPEKEKKRVWIYLVAALALLFGGASLWAIIKFTKFPDTNPDQSIKNAATATPTVTPIVTPTAEPSISPTVEPTPSPTQNISEPNNEKPKPSTVPTTDRTPTPKVTPIQKPTKKPPVKTPKPTQDPNCVFTNSCQ